MRVAEERGVMLIQVALAAMVMFGLAAFAVDYGAAWYARAEIQTAADAGALAGATALELDDKTWPFAANGIVDTSARTTALLSGNSLYAPGTTTAVSSAVCPPYLVAPYDTNCVQVDVYRDGSNGSGTLPTYFANVFGVSSQGVLATATAQVVPANTSGCLRPWFIPDKWQDLDGDNVYDPGEYVGYNATTDIGTTVSFHDNAGPSAYGQLDVGSGTNAIKDAIWNCYAGVTSFSIGDVVMTDPGAKNGQKQAIDDLFTWDPDRSASNPNGVYWDSTSKTIQGGCAAAGNCACPTTAAQCPYGGLQSPRIVQAVMCHPSQPYCVGNGTGKGSITITNILSFFLESYTFNSGQLTLNARLIGSGGMYKPGGGVGPAGSFLTFTRLVR